MAILLTGGAGFIGSHTAVELIKAGHDVVIADNFSNSSPDVVERIGRITGCKVPVLHIDVANARDLDKAFEDHEISSVMHFAGYKAVAESSEKPVAYYRNNLDTALTLLEVMASHGTGQLIFSSSATVYGADAKVPYTEDASAGSCTSPYGRTKYFVEEMLNDAAAANPEMSVVLLRYFNPVGAHESGLIGERPKGIPNNLLPYITQTAAGIRESLKVFGDDYPTCDGTGVRDYIHVVDLAKGHEAALKYASAHRGAEVFNLGTGRGYSVLEVVKAFEKATGVHVPYIIAPRREGDLAEYYADTTKAAQTLGWHAEKSIEEMCADAWRWQQAAEIHG